MSMREVEVYSCNKPLAEEELKSGHKYLTVGIDDLPEVYAWCLGLRKVGVLYIFLSILLITLPVGYYLMYSIPEFLLLRIASVAMIGFCLYCLLQGILNIIRSFQIVKHPIYIRTENVTSYTVLSREEALVSLSSVGDTVIIPSDWLEEGKGSVSVIVAIPYILVERG